MGEPWRFLGKVEGKLCLLFFADKIEVEKSGILKMSGKNLFFFDACFGES